MTQGPDVTVPWLPAGGGQKNVGCLHPFYKEIPLLERTREHIFCCKPYLNPPKFSACGGRKFLQNVIFRHPIFWISDLAKQRGVI